LGGPTYRELTGGVDRVTTMIWRTRNNGLEEERDEPREDSRLSVPAVGDSRAGTSSVGGRVETVLEAAERAARAIREDAERWAREHMEETRRRADELAVQRAKELSSITDELLARAQAVSRQTDELINAVDGGDHGTLKVVSGNDSEPAGTAPSSNHRPRCPAGSVSDGARLLAAQMAVAGSSRDGIASRLREEFGIEDPSAILDEAGL
jgi:hypothetical protein